MMSGCLTQWIAEWELFTVFFHNLMQTLQKDIFIHTAMQLNTSRKLSHVISLHKAAH